MFEDLQRLWRGYDSTPSPQRRLQHRLRRGYDHFLGPLSRDSVLSPQQRLRRRYKIRMPPGKYIQLKV